MSDATISLIVLGAAMALFVANRFPPEIVAVAAALALAASGVIEASDAVAGFGDPTVILITSLFVVSQGLEAAGITAWAGHQLTTRAATPRRTLAMLLGLAGLGGRDHHAQRRDRRARARGGRARAALEASPRRSS